MLNLIVVIGRLGKDPEMTYSQGGKEITKFSVATDDGYGDKKETTWHNVVCFGKTAEACAKFISKGSLVAVQGRQTHCQYEKKDGSRGYFSEVVADRVQFLSRNNDEDPDGLPSRQLSMAGGGDIDPNDLPF